MKEVRIGLRRNLTMTFAVIVTVATTTLVSGVNKVMEGTCAFTDLFNKKLKGL